MSLMYFQTESEARAAVTADGGDPQYNVCWVFSPPNPKSWMARLGSDREYPPPVELTQRQITARLTQQEKESIAAAWVAGNSVLAQCLVLAPTDSDPSFLAEQASAAITQLEADGVLPDRHAARSRPDSDLAMHSEGAMKLKTLTTNLQRIVNLVDNLSHHLEGIHYGRQIGLP